MVVDTWCFASHTCFVLTGGLRVPFQHITSNKQVLIFSYWLRAMIDDTESSPCFLVLVSVSPIAAFRVDLMCWTFHAQRYSRIRLVLLARMLVKRCDNSCLPAGFSHLIPSSVHVPQSGVNDRGVSFASLLFRFLCLNLMPIMYTGSKPMLSFRTNLHSILLRSWSCGQQVSFLLRGGSTKWARMTFALITTPFVDSPLGECDDDSV